MLSDCAVRSYLQIEILFIMSVFKPCEGQERFLSGVVFFFSLHIVFILTEDSAKCFPSEDGLMSPAQYYYIALAVLCAAVY